MNMKNRMASIGNVGCTVFSRQNPGSKDSTESGDERRGDCNPFATSKRNAEWGTMTGVLDPSIIEQFAKRNASMPGHADADATFDLFSFSGHGLLARIQIAWALIRSAISMLCCGQTIWISRSVNAVSQNDKRNRDAEENIPTPATEDGGSGSRDCSAVIVAGRSMSAEEYAAFTEFCARESCRESAEASLAGVIVPFKVLTPEQLIDRQTEQRRRFELERGRGTLPKQGEAPL